jgi:hypothetical protein
MTIKRVLSIGHISDGLRGAKLTEHLTGSQRLSLIEDLRRETAEAFHRAYPKRLRRVPEVAELTRVKK